MRHLVVTECEVPMARRQQFVAAVQRWEEAATKAPGAPEVHSVLLSADDPARVMIVTQFASKQEAESFDSSGLMEEFQRELLGCAATAPAIRSYDLFYSSGSAATRIVFGEEA